MARSCLQYKGIGWSNGFDGLGRTNGRVMMATVMAVATGNVVKGETAGRLEWWEVNRDGEQGWVVAECQEAADAHPDGKANKAKRGTAEQGRARMGREWPKDGEVKGE